MIRDFWKTPQKPNLYEEIEAIKGDVVPATWEAIHAVRQLGNIGAHMKHDINLMVEVDPREAQLLIELIETLFKDWYVIRHERAAQMTGLVQLAKDKTGGGKDEAAPADKVAAAAPGDETPAAGEEAVEASGDQKPEG